MLACGPTGSGKTLLITSQLYTWPFSAVVNDVKGEIWNLTGRYRASLGPVYVVDPIALQHLQRAVCLLLCDSAERSGSKNSACAHVTGTAKWLCRDRHHFPPVFTRTLSLDKKVSLSSTLGSMLSRFKIRKGNESLCSSILPSHPNSSMWYDDWCKLNKACSVEPEQSSTSQCHVV